MPALGALVVDSPEIQTLIPDHYLSPRYPHVESGIPPKVLVWKEQHAPPTLKCPVEHLPGIGGGADDAAMLSTESLEIGGGVHIGHGDHRLQSPVSAPKRSSRAVQHSSTSEMVAMSAIEQPAAGFGKITCW